MSGDHFWDDPVEPLGGENSLSRSRHKFALLGVVAAVAAIFLNTTLAANISLNNGQSVEFGQGFTQTVACSGATNLTITPNSSFTNTSGAGGFYFSSVTVSNIPTS